MMTLLAYAVLAVLGALALPHAHRHEHVLCPGKDNFSIIALAGDSYVIDPPTCDDYVGGTKVTMGGGGPLLVGYK